MKKTFIACALVCAIITLVCVRNSTRSTDTSSQEVVSGEQMGYDTLNVAEYPPIATSLAQSVTVAPVTIAQLPTGWSEFHSNNLPAVWTEKGPEPLLEIGNGEITTFREFQGKLRKASPAEKDRLLKEWRDAEIRKTFGSP